MASCAVFAEPDAGLPEIAAALYWAADRIDYLEGFIESYEAEEARRREGADAPDDIK